jgi:hypothetical protein
MIKAIVFLSEQSAYAKSIDLARRNGLAAGNYAEPLVMSDSRWAVPIYEGYELWFNQSELADSIEIMMNEEGFWIEADSSN